MPRTAIVTGPLGQDGSLLVELLLARGDRVIGVVRPGSARSAPPASADAHIVEADLTDANAVRALLDRWQPDEIHHLAAFHHAAQEQSVSAASAAKEAMLQTNFLTTRTLAFALVDTASPCHLVYAASSQMYTPRRPTDTIDENTPRSPPTFYGHTKSWSLDLLAFLRDDAGLRASTAILFNHESPRRGAQFVSRKITQAAARAARGERTALQLHNLATRVDWSSAYDVVAALALMGGSATPRDLVVASGLLHSVRQMLDAAFGHVSLDWRALTSGREDRAVPALVGDVSTLETALGWTRAWTFEAMIADMVEHDLRQLSARS